MIYRVRYYDARLSKKGRGVQVAVFDGLAEAERFASEHVLYNRPCSVEPLEPAPKLSGKLVSWRSLEIKLPEGDSKKTGENGSSETPSRRS